MWAVSPKWRREGRGGLGEIRAGGREKHESERKRSKGERGIRRISRIIV